MRVSYSGAPIGWRGEQLVRLHQGWRDAPPASCGDSRRCSCKVRCKVGRRGGRACGRFFVFFHASDATKFQPGYTRDYEMHDVVLGAVGCSRAYFRRAQSASSTSFTLNTFFEQKKSPKMMMYSCLSAACRLPWRYGTTSPHFRNIFRSAKGHTASLWWTSFKHGFLYQLNTDRYLGDVFFFSSSFFPWCSCVTWKDWNAPD